MRALSGLRQSWVVAVLVAAVLWAPTAGAKDEAPGPNESCLMCHGDAGAKNAAGNSIAVDAKKFATRCTDR